MIAIDSMRDDGTQRSQQSAYAHASERVAENAAPRSRAVADAQTKNRLGLIASLFFCAAVAIFLVSRYAGLVSENYHIQSLKVSLSHQLARDAALQSTVYDLSSPTRILHLAESVLKMQPATPVQVKAGGH